MACTGSSCLRRSCSELFRDAPAPRTFPSLTPEGCAAPLQASARPLFGPHGSRWLLPGVPSLPPAPPCARHPGSSLPAPFFVPPVLPPPHASHLRARWQTILFLLPAPCAVHPAVPAAPHAPVRHALPFSGRPSASPVLPASSPLAPSAHPAPQSDAPASACCCAAASAPAASFSAMTRASSV